MFGCAHRGLKVLFTSAAAIRQHLEVRTSNLDDGNEVPTGILIGKGIL
jgi:hypothetical protein